MYQCIDFLYISPSGKYRFSIILSQLPSSHVQSLWKLELRGLKANIATFQKKSVCFVISLQIRCATLLCPTGCALTLHHLNCPDAFCIDIICVVSLWFDRSAEQEVASDVCAASPALFLSVSLIQHSSQEPAKMGNETSSKGEDFFPVLSATHSQLCAAALSTESAENKQFGLFYTTARPVPSPPLTSRQIIESYTPKVL